MLLAGQNYTFLWIRSAIWLESSFDSPFVSPLHIIHLLPLVAGLYLRIWEHVVHQPRRRASSRNETVNGHLNNQEGGNTVEILAWLFPTLSISLNSDCDMHGWQFRRWEICVLDW
ncbi:MAG: hypothetical protein CL912_21680 [Deltaproteobacteria bacterium]|nr:hypothetical protein [Deltaproteobacteria bacterium]